ncbi:MAG: hypothetical protein A3B91_02145 [Candidatus Yanofskybacteria bacterium RIFCSPHIGHO2_02_FULL_41_29]|uniref:Type II secretion system protein GspF domain-containing protein n=1 Tax=Candidatus Yanofskybacteria bacterium RIFCSPHIGHO2_01_FULL_41_53 TaxID=1802663 RepID=A0A1F8EG34_9BACT|nr:MAG: hypothetical protein A2650_04980 [Candidatus Yanofskybacteria bacterium RIFCSPHIGHO2_01_FULL_41_53]OGN12327.1 MAG: hypothetical protein A3B91_02145 [Candidatus Yanofskybacteria bacterium RIFCSPHIGHO2_02_FULL_41_29]OGN17714.1 MAG: hypothetical protein A3F48_00550 [Candidatus Yanofskybacteria bacterium RIFCSPHIGHO2_12_FULL_41_9]OGN22020.1 MAG: hypothetical protein A2916_04320 [Candidatus Yanofskybacteria bacterium RIFCSPLOWO2_01_FULL_41_67]OGN28910.1 MAG: hypothetical protein A3H54_02080 
MFKNLFTKLSLKDQVLFTKRLAFLIRADVPILESLKMMQRQTRSRARAKILDKVVEDVSNGQYLSASLSRYNNTFGEFAINIIKVGEEGGILDKNLEYLAEELKKRHELKKKVIGAMIYPIFITVATLGITGIITTYVFPKIMPIFNSLGANLPPTTRLLIAMSNFLVHYGIFVIFGVIAAGILLILAYKKIKPFNYAVSRIFLAVPIFGHLALSYQMANFCRTFGLLLNCNLGIVTAANITANSTTNLVYKREIYKLAEEISKGRKISQHLDTSPTLFPEMVPQLVAIGETTGNLGKTLLYLSDHYEAEVNDLTKNLSSAIEPVLLVFMGVIVGFVAVSVITPIYELTQNLHP